MRSIWKCCRHRNTARRSARSATPTGISSPILRRGFTTSSWLIVGPASSTRLTRGVLSTVSGVVVVASVSIDGAQQASVALDWLRNNGYQDLASRACVVINHIMPGEPNVAVKDLVRHFEQQVQPGRVVVMPWDRHIAAGTEISLDLLDPIYKRKVLELAAALSDDFERAGRR